nr:MAG TPA: hypothetical protein [Caudoviricetes sp.]
MGFHNNLLKEGGAGSSSAFEYSGVQFGHLFIKCV